MKIKSLSFTSFKFFENTQIVCQKEDGSVFQWTILLGNNNTGKTSLLKAIADLRPITLDLQITTKKHLSTKEALQQFIPAGLTANIGSDSNPMEISCTTTLPNLKQWKYSTHGATVSSTPTIDTFRIYAYGVSRYPSKTSLTESQCDDCASLFYPDQRLINIEEWLMQLDYAAKNGNEQARERLERIHELLCGNLFPEIQDFRFESNESLHNYTLFQTEDGWFRYTDLGYGYQSMLS